MVLSRSGMIDADRDRRGRPGSGPRATAAAAISAVSCFKSVCALFLASYYVSACVYVFVPVYRVLHVIQERNISMDSHAASERER